jgi:outer membrane lipoprotein carrier protein
MRWEYEDPEEKLAISDGRRGWLYLPAEKRAMRVDLEGRLGGGPIAELLAGDPAALRAFGAEKLPADEGLVGLRLVPVSRAEEFESVAIWADSGTLRLSKVVVVDPGGNSMVYWFTEMEEDVGLSDALFSFDPPAGVEISDW